MMKKRAREREKETKEESETDIQTKKGRESDVILHDRIKF